MAVKEIQALDLDRASAKTILAEWLALAPPVGEVLDVVPALTSPTEATIRTYSNHLRVSDRTQLWTGLESAGASTQLLSAVAQAPEGLSLEAVHHVRRQVEAERQQTGRATLVKRLLTVSLNATPLHGAACDLALYLLDTQNQGDAMSAASIVVHAGGAAHGYTGKLKAALQAADDRNAKTFTKTQKEALARHSLLRRPKKGVIERMLDW